MNSYIEKYKITVPRSAEAWIVPGQCVLEMWIQSKLSAD